MNQASRPANDIERHIQARSRFASLLVQEPEYFQKIFPVSGSTIFEQLTCVGLEPDQHALYATIAVKHTTGYGGDLCTRAGGREYVRFFVDWNGDGDFTDAAEDLGVASVAVHDIPGPKPLVYSVTVPLTREQGLCFLARPVKVRAVLMYNAVPPAGDPDPFIVWGGILDVNVQPRSGSLVLGDLLAHAQVKLAPAFAELVDTKAPVAKSTTLTPAQVVALYAGDETMPLHRSLGPQLATIAQAMSADAGKAQPAALASSLQAAVGTEVAAKLDLSNVIGAYLDLDGDTSFEELHCVGLHPDLSAVVGVLEIKRPAGYSGGPCTSGSLEFVSFWADWDDSGSWDQYLGTAQVRVHDEQVPPGGIRYAVFLPVNLAPHRRPCGQSHTARIRAVLSWNTPPASTNPYAVPRWGNHVEALVQLPVGEPEIGQVPFISVVGGMAVADIDGAGLATGTAVMAGFHASNSPFAGMVSIAGHISNPPDLSAGQPALTYGLKFRKDGDVAVHDIADSFQVTLSRYSGSVWTQTQPMQIANPGTHRFPYLEDLTPNGPAGDITFVEGFLLGKWKTGVLADGRYEVWMEADIGGSTVESNHVWVQLDNTAPKAVLALNGDPFTPKGTDITGTFEATDDHFGSWSLGVVPGGYPHAPSPAGDSAPRAAGTPFTLSTNLATPGGYVLHLQVTDRSIVNSGSIGLTTPADVGFCVEKP
ncbi:MAG TPA: hypothetical protein VFJ85_11865 [Acidimicrobiales bacterium]|nr:hypothetical protein [Acidimicrobiales bacterium]